MDKISPDRRSNNMRAIKSKDMRPELAVRSLAHRIGYRYRLHAKDLPGKPDLTFPARRKVIFVHGCFWHQHRDSKCKIARVPKSNRDYWIPKLRRNRDRDTENLEALKSQGWTALVIWECETENPLTLKKRIIKFLGKR